MDLIVNLDVDDLDRAQHFYQQAFGLKPARRLGSDALELLGATAPLWLLRKASGSPASGTIAETRRYSRHWTPVHLDFVVDEIDSAVERALAAGAVLEQPVATQAWGRLALMADSFGHGFCLLQFLNRGYDEIAE